MDHDETGSSNDAVDGSEELRTEGATALEPGISREQRRSRRKR